MTNWLPTRLTEIRRLRAKARDHNTAPCDHRWGTTPTVDWLPNGKPMIFEGCARCTERIGPARWLSPKDYDVERLPVHKDFRYQNGPCLLCGEWGTEIHHFAPRALFEDADNWPTAPLCPDCHRHWHDMMGLDQYELIESLQNRVKQLEILVRRLGANAGDQPSIPGMEVG